MKYRSRTLGQGACFMSMSSTAIKQGFMLRVITASEKYTTQTANCKQNDGHINRWGNALVDNQLLADSIFHRETIQIKSPFFGGISRFLRISPIWNFRNPIICSSIDIRQSKQETVWCPLCFRLFSRNQYQFGSFPHVFNLINCIKLKPIIKQ